MKAMRAFLMLAGLAVLGGCNVVINTTPLLTAADEAGAPALRPGVWRGDADPSCVVDESRPMTDWPACGGGAVIGPGQATYHDKDAAAGVMTHDPFIFAAGEPRIAQARLNIKGDIKFTDGAARYAYAGARATKVDDQGRILAIALWPIQCGPPRTGAPDGSSTTQHPFPGMVIKQGDPFCTTASVAALRGAAAPSEAWAPAKLGAHWVRDASS
jgi:hypothetical protein